MAFDGFFTKALANELNGLSGARVEKVFHTASACIEIAIYKDKQKQTLILSALPSAPYCAVKNGSGEHPQVPTAFCQLLRKHLQPSRIESVYPLPNERVICFDFDCTNELGHHHKKRLYAELMGKFSNIILTDESRVLGALYTSDITASKRRIMPGLPYEAPPPQDKIPVYGVSKEQFLTICNENGNKKAERLFIEKFYSFSPLVARELCFRASKKTDALISECDSDRLYHEFKRLADCTETDNYTPCALFENKKPLEFSFMHINQYGPLIFLKEYESFSKLLVDFYGMKESSNLIIQQSNELFKILNTKLTQIEKRMSAQRADLEECKNRSIYKKNGDLITSNIYKMKQGDKYAECYDYETEEMITVELDERQTPANNAQIQYKKYQKLKTAEAVLVKRIEANNLEKLYLESVFDCLARAETEREIDELKSELSEIGYINKKVKKQKPLPPVIYTTTDGMTVRVGRNNLQNDELTKSADKNDIWFHVKGFPGSHTILQTEGKEPTDRDYTEAAAIAAKHSSVKEGKNIAVDYTRVRNIKKPAGAKPGYVIYETYYTAYVDPAE